MIAQPSQKGTGLRNKFFKGILVRHVRKIGEVIYLGDCDENIFQIFNRRMKMFLKSLI